METKISNRSLHIPETRGRVSVPMRAQCQTTQNIGLDSAVPKPVVTALPNVSNKSVINKPTTNRVTFDTMMQPRLQTANVVQTLPPIQSQPQVQIQQVQPQLQPQPQLQTAVQVAAEQPTATLPMRTDFSDGGTMALPMLQVAPIQEVAPVSENKKSLNLSKSFHKNLAKLKDGVKKIDIKKIDIKKMKDFKPVKINVRVGDIVRYAVVAVVLIISGYLAYDTWTTNQQAKDIFNQSAAATSSGGDVANNSATAANSEPVYTVEPGMPKYLSIPKIGVTNAKVEQVGLLGNNKVGTPKDLNNVAWYDGSAKPGQNGALFINGHINDVGAGGIFNNLRNVAVGDKVIVERGDGTKFNYEVVHTETIPTSSINMDNVLKARGSEKGLNMMTCAGTYNFNTMSYSHRMIVYSVLI